MPTSMKRQAETSLTGWLRAEGRKPLLVRGARQVGKSTLVRMFAQNQGLTLCEVNLERHRYLENAFATMNVSRILREVAIGTNFGPFDPEKSILFLDEIQAVPDAIQALRYFYEDMPQLPVIAAGSLLEFALEKKSFSMPVGRVQYLYLGPMTFEEFLEACGESALREELAAWHMGSTFTHAAHERLAELLRDYLFVGGLPEAVAAYARARCIAAAFDVHGAIIENYRDDFGKYASGKDLERLQRLFDTLPGCAMRGKFKYVTALPDEHSREARSALMLLVKAGVAALVHHTPCSGLPLASGADERVFKILLIDVGVLHTSLGAPEVPSALLVERILTTEGRAAEQFIGQHLLFAGDLHRRPSLHYWLREGRSSNAEVDFVISHQARIVPVEVKSGKEGSLRSLHRFVAEKNTRLALRFDLNPPSVQDIVHTVEMAAGPQHITYRLLSLPLYLVGQTTRLLAECGG